MCISLSLSLSLSHTLTYSLTHSLAHTHTHTHTQHTQNTHILTYMLRTSSVFLLCVYIMYIENYCSVGSFGVKFLFCIFYPFLNM